jgi:peptide/nickel transport system substrate-binding protein
VDALPSLRSRLRMVAAAAAGASVLAACTSPASMSASGPATLKLAALFLPSSLDPAKGIDAIFAFVETLTHVDDRGNVVPFLLTKAPERTDAKHWILTLRKGVTFQDGHPMTAGVVAAALNREMKLSDEAKTELPGAVFTATGDDRVTVATPVPENLLPGALADPAFAVYDEPVVTAAGTLADALVGKGVFTAPYAITAFSENAMKLTAYANYWQGKPALSGVQITHVPDGQARVAAVESGQVDIADGANAPEVLAAVKGHNDVKVRLSDVPLDILKLYLNPSTGPLKDTAVRQALALGLDYNQLATEFTGGVGEATSGLLPNGYPMSVPVQRTDPARAATLLDAAGWKAGPDGIRAKNGQKLTVNLLIYNERPVFKPLSIGIQSMLKKIGVGVNIITQPFDYKMYDATKWNLALYNDYSLAPSGIPDTYMGTYLGSKGSGNYWHIADDTLDGLLAKLSRATTEPQRKAGIAAVETYVWDHAYVSAVAFVKDAAVVGKNWSTYTPDVGYQQQSWTWTTAPAS